VSLASSILSLSFIIALAAPQIVSNDGGVSFEQPYVADTVIEPLEGCEGSLVRYSKGAVDRLFFSVPSHRSPVRTNLTVFRSDDEGLSWQQHASVDPGASSYSSLQIDERGAGGSAAALEILYERSDTVQLVFSPEQIVFWRTTVV
jgi:hypothetical protein